MATFQTFDEMESWQKARELAREIYVITKQETFYKDFVLRDQIRRACVSVISNIAEGFERSGTGEFVHFLSMAKGSAGELRSQLYIAFDQKYITEETLNRLQASASEIGKMIGGLMGYLRNSNIKGPKYKSGFPDSSTRNSKL